MDSYLILCQSLTYAQRTAKMLERYGIGSQIIRTPREITAEGCGHCVKIGGGSLDAARRVLQREGLAPKHIYRAEKNAYSEVSL